MRHVIQTKDKSEGSRFLKAATFRQNTRKTEPHKHNSYLELIYLSAGRGYHCVDNTTYEVRPPVVFFVRKEQVHYWDLEDGTEPQGFVVILKKPFFEQSLDGELKSLLSKVSKLSCLYFEDDATIQQLLASLTRESMEFLPGAKYTFSLQEGLTKALFAKILQLAKPGRSDIGNDANLLVRFRDFLGKEDFKQHSVAYYAGLLHTTPQNLNAICRKSANQSASQVLAESIIEEAKRLLLYTDQRVSEISFSLAFGDPSHFVKYFKRYTGCTPQVFRTARQ